MAKLLYASKMLAISRLLDKFHTEYVREFEHCISDIIGLHEVLDLRLLG